MGLDKWNFKFLIGQNNLTSILDIQYLNFVAVLHAPKTFVVFALNKLTVAHLLRLIPLSIIVDLSIFLQKLIFKKIDIFSKFLKNHDNIL